MSLDLAEPTTAFLEQQIEPPLSYPSSSLTQRANAERALLAASLGPPRQHLSFSWASVLAH